MATACNQGAKPDSNDQTTPTVTLENPVGGAAVSLSVTVQGTATDDTAVTRVTYQLNGGTEQSLTITPAPRVNFSFSVQLKTGQNVIVVNAYDATGNIGSATLNITYGTSSGGSPDTLRPDISILTPTPGSTVDSPSVSVQGKARDNLGVVRIAYQLNGGPEQNIDFTPGPNVTYTAPVNGLIPGSNTIILNAYDAAGNKDSASTRVVYSGSSPGPTPSPTPTPTPSPSGTAQPALVKAYWMDKILDATQTQVSTQYMQYRPRQFNTGLSLIVDPAAQQEADFKLDDPGVYKGWDALIMPANGSYVAYTSSDDMLELYLNREAKVGLLWYGNPADRPSWMSDWQTGSTVKAGGNTYTVFLKNLPAGKNLLHGIDRKAGRIYTVLLAEKDGTPTPPPAVPSGHDLPQPNAYCPDWVAERYTVELGGKVYPTWKPQIDPVYWCYFGNEHGSDPAQFPQIKALLDSGSLKIPFGNVEDAGNATPMCVSCHQTRLGKSVVKSPPQTFKLFALDDRQGHLWVVKFQLGSSNRARLCQRHHEYGIWAFDRSTGEMLAALQFAPDFGPALNASVGNNTYYKPDLCPDNLDIPMNGEVGRRRIPLISVNGYETWQPAFPRQLGFFGYGRAYNLDNPITRCSDERDALGFYTCNQVSKTGSAYNKGENRWFIIPGGDQPDGGFGIDASRAIATGNFCTNVLGTELRDCGAADAVPQYIKPGIRILHKDQFRWIPYDPWWVEYRPVASGSVNFEGHNLENALRDPN